MVQFSSFAFFFANLYHYWVSLRYLVYSKNSMKIGLTKNATGSDSSVSLSSSSFYQNVKKNADLSFFKFFLGLIKIC